MINKVNLSVKLMMVPPCNNGVSNLNSWFTLWPFGSLMYKNKSLQEPIVSREQCWSNKMLLHEITNFILVKCVCEDTRLSWNITWFHILAVNVAENHLVQRKLTFSFEALRETQGHSSSKSSAPHKREEMLNGRWNSCPGEAAPREPDVP